MSRMARCACMCVCQLMIVEVIQCSHIDEFTNDQHSPSFSFQCCIFAFSPLASAYSRSLHSSSSLSLSLVFFLFVEMSLADTHLLLILSSYLFPRERYRTLETTYRIACQIQRRKSNSYRFQQAYPFDMALYLSRNAKLKIYSVK